MARSAGSRSVVDPRAERAERVEALGPRPLRLAALQVAGGDVVGAGVAEHHVRARAAAARRGTAGRSRRPARPRSAPRSETPTGYCIGVAGADHRRGRLEEDDRRLGRGRRRRPSPARARRSSCRSRRPCSAAPARAAGRSASGSSSPTSWNGANGCPSIRRIVRRLAVVALDDAERRSFSGGEPRDEHLRRLLGPCCGHDRLPCRPEDRRRRRAARDGAGRLLLRGVRAARARPVAVPALGGVPRARVGGRAAVPAPVLPGAGGAGGRGRRVVRHAQRRRGLAWRTGEHPRRRTPSALDGARASLRASRP